MEKAFFNLGIILTNTEISELKGGTAEVSSATREASSAGDGAEYVCCIKVNIPSHK